MILIKRIGKDKRKQLNDPTTMEDANNLMPGDYSVKMIKMMNATHQELKNLDVLSKQKSLYIF